MTCYCGCGKKLSGGQTKWASRSCRWRAGRLTTTDGKANIDRIAKLIADSGIDPEQIGAIEKVRLNEWEGLTKDNDGNPVVTKLSAASLILSPTWDSGPQWPVVQQAAPVKVTRAKGKPKSGKWKTAVVLPDPQIGFRRNGDELDPFHDERAMAVALEITASLNPDKVVQAGDVVDLAGFGKYVQEASFAQTMQPAIDRAHRWLGETIEAAPNAEHEYMEGNHDRRIQDFITKNALAAFGLRRANIPDDWPVMSIPHLLRLDELGIRYIGGYPNGRTWINDNLAVSHGPAKLKSSGSSAHASIDDERVSLIFGHVHRIELAHKTRNVREGYRTNLLASPGCLCRIDGAVPSYKGSTDPFGNAVTNYENWQQGIAVATYEEGNGRFSVELVPIFDGAAVFRGQLFTAPEAAAA